MGKKRILFASQEITPYLPDTYMSNLGLELPKSSIEIGDETRVFLPKFGVIKEKTNNLHEVIRLSGMNLIIDDFDHQLIIKVASIQSARMQIYFIDNDEYFSEKTMFHDLNGKFLKNNEERMIFYCKGVIETVKKLGWSPEIIHCQGWFSSLIPLYIKLIYNEDPLFKNTKLVYNIFDNDFDGELNADLINKLLFEKKLNTKDLSLLKNPSFVNLSKFAIKYSDAVIQGSKQINNDISKYIKKSKLPLMTHNEEYSYEDSYNTFFNNIIEKKDLELSEKK
ncbi:MAG: glycogen synthase [Flavobacteriales bacterium]|nr:glycogen synthase [Flavobacteriales bacterium]|tara:strand:- start:715 stop:1554 length:840 start_codon:yes stop_codon:yes gene_type:complete